MPEWLKTIAYITIAVLLILFTLIAFLLFAGITREAIGELKDRRKNGGKKT